MNISIFLAQVFGLLFMIVGVAMLTHFKVVMAVLKSTNTLQVIYFTGLTALMVGIPLVLVHNVWDGSWRVIITAMIWLTLLKGVTRVFFPRLAIRWVENLTDNLIILRVGIWGMLILGVYLAYIGFIGL